LQYRYRDTTYHIAVEQVDPEEQGPGVWVDDVLQSSAVIALVNDLARHDVRVVVRSSAIVVPDLLAPSLA
jgi:hypothetical protein